MSSWTTTFVIIDIILWQLNQSLHYSLSSVYFNISNIHYIHHRSHPTQKYIYKFTFGLSIEVLSMNFICCFNHNYTFNMQWRKKRKTKFYKTIFFHPFMKNSKLPLSTTDSSSGASCSSFLTSISIFSTDKNKNEKLFNLKIKNKKNYFNFYLQGLDVQHELEWHSFLVLCLFFIFQIFYNNPTDIRKFNKTPTKKQT